MMFSCSKCCRRWLAADYKEDRTTFLWNIGTTGVSHPDWAQSGTRMTPFTGREENLKRAMHLGTRDISLAVGCAEVLDLCKV